METLAKTLRRTKTGYGHFTISIEIDGVEYNATTTNTMAIDAAFDENYNDEDNSGRFFETREEAQNALINEIIYANDLSI
jgi:hypothetical protein